MSDAKDAVDEAKRRNRQLAARCLVRVQDVEAQIARSGSSEALDTELAAAKYDYNAALAELKELDRLGAKAEALEARTIAASIDRSAPLGSGADLTEAAGGGDPVIR